MKRFCLMLLVGLASWSQLSSQTYRQYIKAADDAAAGRNYFAAMKYYQEAISIDGEKPEILFKYAEAARKFESYTFADTAYTKVLALDNSKSFPLAAFWLAGVKKKQGKYEDSRALFRQFNNNRNSKVDEDYYKRAQMEIDALAWVIDAVHNIDPNISIQQLDSNINSPFSEFAGSLKENEFYYSSENFEKIPKKGMAPRQYSRVMIASDDGKRIRPAAFNDETKQTAHAVFNKNNTRLYYTICDFIGETAIIQCNIYYRNIQQNGEYGPAVRLPDHINMAGFTATQPTIGYMEGTRKEWLFFVSDRPEGKGNLDIWASIIDEAGEFSKPANILELNTTGNDVTPFFHNPSKTLYFSSDYRQGFGGFDIYKSFRSNNQWSRVENLALPFNSSYNDIHFWINPEQTKGYFASSRLGSRVLEPEFEACCNDLYLFTVQVIDLNVLTFNKKDNSPLSGVTIELTELSQNSNIISSTKTNANSNNFQYELKKGNKYFIAASKPNFLPYRDTIDLTNGNGDDLRKIERKIFLLPETVELNILSFNKKTMNPLRGVEVRLAVDGQEVDYKINKEDNRLSFILERGINYELIGSKVAYFSDTAKIYLRNDYSTAVINQILQLKPKEIEDFPPLVIYFDNDHPNPRTRQRVTEFAYEPVWKNYMAKQDLFANEYVRSLVGQDSFASAKRIEAFFEREVNNGYEALLRFSESAYQILSEGGFKVELIIQGFTSPRASADYNFDLSQRRADCLKNHFETWNNGALLPFIRRGTLTMEVVGYGEKLAPQYISDRLDDERESIYSVVASFERKVAIIGARKVADR